MDLIAFIGMPGPLEIMFSSRQLRCLPSLFPEIGPYALEFLLPAVYLV